MGEPTTTADAAQEIAALRGQLAAAERRAAVLDEALAAVFHDLRGPLNTMLGWATLLRRTAPAEMSRGLEVVERNARLQAWMLEDGSDLYRIAGGAAARTAPAVDLRALTREVVSEARAGLGAQVAFDEGETSPVTTRADAAMLRRALRAVLTHFARARESSAQVTVGARDGEAWVRLVDPQRGAFPFEALAAFQRDGALDGAFSRGAGLALLVAGSAGWAHQGGVRAVPDGLELWVPRGA